MFSQNRPSALQSNNPSSFPFHESESGNPTQTHVSSTGMELSAQMESMSLSGSHLPAPVPPPVMPSFMVNRATPQPFSSNSDTNAPFVSGASQQTTMNVGARTGEQTEASMNSNKMWKQQSSLPFQTQNPSFPSSIAVNQTNPQIPFNEPTNPQFGQQQQQLHFEPQQNKPPFYSPQQQAPFARHPAPQQSAFESQSFGRQTPFGLQQSRAPPSNSNQEKWKSLPGMSLDHPLHSQPSDFPSQKTSNSQTETQSSSLQSSAPFGLPFAPQQTMFGITQQPSEFPSQQTYKIQQQNQPSQLDQQPQMQSFPFQSQELYGQHKPSNEALAGPPTFPMDPSTSSLNHQTTGQERDQNVVLQNNEPSAGFMKSQQINEGKSFGSPQSQNAPFPLRQHSDRPTMFPPSSQSQSGTFARQQQSGQQPHYSSQQQQQTPFSATQGGPMPSPPQQPAIDRDPINKQQVGQQWPFSVPRSESTPFPPPLPPPQPQQQSDQQSLLTGQQQQISQQFPLSGQQSHPSTYPAQQQGPIPFQQQLTGQQPHFLATQQISQSMPFAPLQSHTSAYPAQQQQQGQEFHHQQLYPSQSTFPMQSQAPFSTQQSFSVPRGPFAPPAPTSQPVPFPLEQQSANQPFPCGSSPAFGSQHPPTAPFGSVGQQFHHAYPSGVQQQFQSSSAPFSSAPQPQKFLNPEQLPSYTAIKQAANAKYTNTIQPTVSPSEPIPPLAIILDNVAFYDTGNCNPRYVRSSIYGIPTSSDILKQSQIPFALALTPMAEPNPAEEPLACTRFPVIPVRCSRCQAYMCPWMKFQDGGNRFQCPMCDQTSETPGEYFAHTDFDGKRTDHSSRPELCRFSYEIMATSEYCKKGVEPKSAAFVFLIDLTYASVRSGLLKVFCENLSGAVLTHLPLDPYKQQEGGPRVSPVSVCVIGYDSRLHFFHSKDGDVDCMVLADTSSIFLPLSDDLFISSTEIESRLKPILEKLPIMYEQNQSTEASALTCAIRAGCELLKQSQKVGKLFVMNASVTPECSSKRNDQRALGTDKEKNIISPGNKVYSDLGANCIEVGCSVELFLFPNQFIDVSTLGEVCRVTNGHLHLYRYFTAETDSFRLMSDLTRSISRVSAYDAIMRVRTSTGLRATDFIGNIEMRTSTEMEFGVMDCDTGVFVELKHDDKIPDDSMGFIQVALLYTSVGGVRLIRVHNLTLPTVSSLPKVYSLCDYETITAYMTKVA
ncbi:hypothetical protein ACOME3_010814, partial [Neoechinorhynchus agilis]